MQANVDSSLKAFRIIEKRTQLLVTLQKRPLYICSFIPNTTIGIYLYFHLIPFDLCIVCGLFTYYSNFSDTKSFHGAIIEEIFSPKSVSFRILKNIQEEFSINAAPFVYIRWNWFYYVEAFHSQGSGGNFRSLRNSYVIKLQTQQRLLSYITFASFAAIKYFMKTTHISFSRNFCLKMVEKIKICNFLTEILLLFSFLSLKGNFCTSDYSTRISLSMSFVDATQQILKL